MFNVWFLCQNQYSADSDHHRDSLILDTVDLKRFRKINSIYEENDVYIIHKWCLEATPWFCNIDSGDILNLNYRLNRNISIQ